MDAHNMDAQQFPPAKRQRVSYSYVEDDQEGQPQEVQVTVSNLCIKEKVAPPEYLSGRMEAMAAMSVMELVAVSPPVAPSHPRNWTFVFPWIEDLNNVPNFFLASKTAYAAATQWVLKEDRSRMDQLKRDQLRFMICERDARRRDDTVPDWQDDGATWSGKYKVEMKIRMALHAMVMCNARRTFVHFLPRVLKMCPREVDIGATIALADADLLWQLSKFTERFFSFSKQRMMFWRDTLLFSMKAAVLDCALSRVSPEVEPGVIHVRNLEDCRCVHCEGRKNYCTNSVFPASSALMAGRLDATFDRRAFAVGVELKTRAELENDYVSKTRYFANLENVLTSQHVECILAIRSGERDFTSFPFFAFATRWRKDRAAGLAQEYNRMLEQRDEREYQPSMVTIRDTFHQQLHAAQ